MQARAERERDSAKHQVIGRSHQEVDVGLRVVRPMQDKIAGFDQNRSDSCGLPQFG